MDFNLPPVSGIDPTANSPRSTGSAKGAGFDAALKHAAVTVDTIPASPPPDVLEQMQEAAQMADKLRAMKRELHFEPQPNGRVIVQVRDLDGNVIRTIPPSAALEVAAGKPLE
jgi:flagellar protein FlaG